ncbi:MAG: sensor histidine kinase [Opitutaceae bacterium]
MTLNRPDLRTHPERNSWQHSAFWLVMVGLVTLNVYMAPAGGEFTALLWARVAFNLLCFAAVVYLHLFVLIPRLFERGRYAIYAVTFVISAIVAAYFIYQGTAFLRDTVFGGDVMSSPTGKPTHGFGPPGGQSGFSGPPNGFKGGRPSFKPPFEKLMMIWAIQAMIVTGMAVIFHLANKYIRDVDTEKHTIEAELTALKAQLSPHFLFNSLNNIYSLSLAKSDDAPVYTMKLSKITRYILHETGQKTILLQKELDFISDYIVLERIRLCNEVKIKCRFEGNTDGVMIAPLIILPFIENVFKHGVNPDPDNAEVDIWIAVEANGLIDIRIANRVPKDGAVNPEGEGGVGLANVRRRLNLLYPGKYELDIKQTSERCSVSLTLIP